MTRKSSPTLCPLLWNHFSANIDSSMRICCNTDNGGFVLDGEGKRVYLKQIKDVKEYFNLGFLKDIRRKMLNGDRPAICRKCYEIEDSGGRSVRQDYADIYAQDQRLQETINLTSEDGTAFPEINYIDFALSNRCNIRCMMCSPHASHLLASDFKKLGIPFDESWEERSRTYWDIENILPVYDQILPNVSSMLTTGGEPFINATHLALLERAVEIGRSRNIVLRYHTNCTTLPSRLVELWRHFQKIEVHVSLEAFGALNEYIRLGTRWPVIEKNFAALLKLKSEIPIAVEVHTCLQIANILRLTELYQWLETWNGNCPPLPYHIMIDHPDQLHIRRMPHELKLLAVEQIDGFLSARKPVYSASVYHAWADEKVATVRAHLNRMTAEPWDPGKWNESVAYIRTLEKMRKTPLTSLVPEFEKYFGTA